MGVNLYKGLVQLNAKKKLIKKWAKEVNKAFSKEDIQMAHGQMKTLSISCHQGNADQNHNATPPTPVGTAYVVRTGRKGILARCCWGQNRSCRCGKRMEGPRQINNTTTIWPSNPNSGHISQGNETGSQRDICTPKFMKHYSRCQDMETDSMSMDG